MDAVRATVVSACCLWIAVSVCHDQPASHQRNSRCLQDSGRTVVCTIHQPSLDIFEVQTAAASAC